MTAPEPFPSSRREARELAARSEREGGAGPTPARHRRRRAARARGAVVLAAVTGLAVWGTVSIATALAAPPEPEPPAPASAVAEERAPEAPPIAATLLPVPDEGLPTPTVSGSVAGRGLCDGPDVTAALERGDDAGVISAVGGPERFREIVAAGSAPCIRLDDPTRAWVVVNKLQPYAPVDYAPAPLAQPEGVRSLDGSALRADAAEALSALGRGARDAGVGELAMASGYRSYATQTRTYSGHLSARGAERADVVSARPGHSEHQSGLGADVVACDGSCGTLDDLAGTPQGSWLAQHAWEYGWIVRYQEGRTDVTGYVAEPWHIRYIGVDLARAYHDGGWTTLEEFFGLPAAPTYAS